jgi:DNA-binding NtrC family response regulator
MSAFGTVEIAVEAMKKGAVDFLPKPFSLDHLTVVVEKALEVRKLRDENRELREALGQRYQFENIIGRSEAMQDIFATVTRVAPTRATVLLAGESGVGKDMIARAIHQHSPRKDRPFVKINCTAIPENLMESELFGYEKGAFTGANTSKPGKFEIADTGTVFLDEIGDVPGSVQVKLLRVLQERRFRRVGGLEELVADIRVIAATNQDLTKAVAEGRFREDLYYRINVIPIALPALRERREDIPLLAEHFLAKYSEQMGKPITGISHGALELLVGHDWPGNIRELENVIERAVALEATPSILADSLPATIRQESPRPAATATAPSEGLPAAGFDLEAHVKEIERGYIAEALKRADGVQVRAAELLGMSFRSFRYYVKKYNLR